MRATFYSYDDFIEEVIKKDNKNFRRNLGDRDNFFGPEKGWCGPKADTKEETLKLVRNGWHEGRSMVRAISDRLNVVGRVPKPEIAYDVTGDTWDIGRLVNGEPECAMHFEDSEDEFTLGPKVLRMGINVGVSAGIDENIMRHRGAAILALIEALEYAGKRIEIWTICGDRTDGPWKSFNNPPMDVRVRLKKSEELMQDDMLIFSIVHPAYSRRLNLGLVENYMPGDPPGVEKEYDLYFPCMFLHDINWADPETVDNWIQEKLYKYGITISDY